LEISEYRFRQWYLYSSDWIMVVDGEISAGLKNEPGGLDSGPGDFISFAICLKIKAKIFCSEIFASQKIKPDGSKIKPSF